MDDDLVIANPPADLLVRANEQLIHDDHFVPALPAPPEKDIPLAAGKGGEDYDACPAGCAQDIDPYYRIPKAGGGDLFTKYQCPCCGLGWERASEEGYQHDVEHNQAAYTGQRRTQAAAVGRVTFTPTKRYSANYARVFGHD